MERRRTERMSATRIEKNYQIRKCIFFCSQKFYNFCTSQKAHKSYVNAVNTNSCPSNWNEYISCSSLSKEHKKKPKLYSYFKLNMFPKILVYLAAIVLHVRLAVDALGPFMVNEIILGQNLSFVCCCTCSDVY